MPSEGLLGRSAYMMRALILSATIVLFVLPLCSQESTAQNDDQCFRSNQPAQCELKAGVESYKQAQFDLAMMHFRRALEFDPKLVKAQLYLATTLANECTPGVETPDNKQVCEQAVSAYSAVLGDSGADTDDRLIADKSLASLSFWMKKFDEAKDYNRKVIALDPNDPEAYYSIGVIDWTESYKPRMEARNKLNLQPDQPLLDLGVCQKLAADYLPVVQDGMAMLTKAMELRPDYDDAMAYMNLIYRERADYRCGDKAAREADLLQADKWVDQTLAVKKVKAERQRTATPQPRKP